MIEEVDQLAGGLRRWGSVLGSHRLAKLGSLGALGRDPQHLSLPLEVDAERRSRPCAYGAAGADLKEPAAGPADVGHRIGDAPDQGVPTFTTASVMRRDRRGGGARTPK